MISGVMLKMLKKRGILISTFIFTSILISIVILISFGVLYFALPDYYFYLKQNTLEDRAEVLAQDIKNAKTDEEIINSISEFSSLNNAIVMAYDENVKVIFEYSSPFNLYYQGSEDKPNIKFKYEEILDAEENSNINRKKELIIFKNHINDSINFQKYIGSKGIAHIDISGTLQPINETKYVMLTMMPFLLIIDILIALIAAYIFSKKITKPIVTLSDAARQMQILEPGIKSGLSMSNEIGELSQNLDLLYEKLCTNINNLKCEMNKVCELEKSKTDFMRAASHELKTPISALSGIIEGMLDNVGVYKERDKYLLKSKKLVDDLTNLLNEILNASKLQITENIINLEQIKLFELIESSLDDNQLFIDEKHLKINFQKLEFTVQSNNVVLRTIISNIISNAVRYTRENGTINISMTDELNLYHISIENQCDNIPENELQKLFEPFYTRNYSRNKNRSGTGLGLYIVKKNLEKLELSYKLENTTLGLKFNIYFVKTAQ